MDEELDRYAAVTTQDILEQSRRIFRKEKLQYHLLLIRKLIVFLRKVPNNDEGTNSTGYTANAGRERFEDIDILL
ncbi:MAG: hypothetical protein IPH18_18205 [Chitinophagaceae bacterium]|nr:hypothetical protein [Chitinophagaceae bacterium]